MISLFIIKTCKILKMSAEIDEGLYSRQLYALGHETMGKICDTTIMICGVNSLGLEVSKNSILSGFKHVILCDDTENNVVDISSNYYSTDDYHDKNKVDTIYEKLKDLNTYVNVTIVKEKLDINTILKNNVNVLVFCDFLYYSEICKFNDLDVSAFCHDNKIKFILCDSIGLIGRVFCDFGNHIIHDVDGENPANGIIEEITKTIDEKDNSVYYSFTTNDTHNVPNGGKVTFSVSNDDIFTIETVKSNIFKIKNPENNIFDNYVKTDENKLVGMNMHFYQVKEGRNMTFEPYNVQKNKPSLCITNYLDMDRHEIIHKILTFIEEISTKKNIFNKIDMLKFG